MSIVLPSVATSQLVRAQRNIPIAMLSPPKVPPRAIVAEFNWSTDYGLGTAKPNANVLVGMQAGGAQQPIDAIRSVKIDNLGNSTPVYVYFLDSTDEIVCPPNTEVWTPVVTNSKLANVITLGATDSGLGTTRVYFANVLVPPYVNSEVSQSVALWKASANVSRGGNITNTNYGVPSLCDQSTDVEISLTGGTRANINFNNITTGFIYVNVLQLIVINLTAPVAASLNEVVIENQLGTLTPLWRWRWTPPTGLDGFTIPFAPVCGMNLKIDASLHWQIIFGAGPTQGGQALLTIGFTSNPT